MIRHFVHLRFRKDIDRRQKQTLFDRLAALAWRMEGVSGFQHRENISVETPLLHGFLDMFWLDFQNAGVREAYLTDQEHQAIGADIIASLEGAEEGIFVCDITL